MNFRRRRGRQGTFQTDPPGDGQDATTGAGMDPPRRGDRPRGPWDVDEVDDDPTYVDLGGLRVKGRPGLELQIKTDPQTGQVVAVMLAAQDGAVEVRAFAAPRSVGIWDDVRGEIAAEVTRLGGTVTAEDGAFGPELAIAMPVALEDGRQATQPSRVVGVQGPRWLLRATFLGRPAVQADAEGLLETALRDVVVVRGDEPMAPRDALGLRLPSDARPWGEQPE